MVSPCGSFVKICLCVILSQYLALIPTPPEYLHFSKALFYEISLTSTKGTPKHNLLRETASPMTLLSAGDSLADRESEALREGEGGQKEGRKEEKQAEGGH